MPTPPLLFLEPRDVVQRIRHSFACTGDEAAAFLSDAWLAGMIVPRFMGRTPPAGYDPTEADWFSGEIVIRTEQQTSTIPIGGYDPFETFDREQRGLPPEEYRYPTRTLTQRYPFKIDRRQLDVLLGQFGSAVTRPDDPGVGGTVALHPSQSEKATLRRRVKDFLETEARIDPPRGQTKADWRQLAGQEFGDAVTDNLFETAWEKAELPAAWRAPGRRT